MKYVVYQDGDKEHMVTFPRCINHNDMAEALGSLRFGGVHWHRRQGKIVSAGVIDGGKCHGRSEALSINSRPSDTALLKQGGIATASTPEGV